MFISLFLTSCLADSQKASSALSSAQIDLLEKFNCEQTVRAYAHSRDHIDWQDNIALFTQDAVIQFGALKLEGREQIKQALLERGPKQFTRHIIASVSVARREDGTLSGTSYAVVYGADPNLDEPKPLVDNSVAALLTYNDVFDSREGRCLIAQRTVTLDMARQNEQ